MTVSSVYYCRLSVRNLYLVRTKTCQLDAAAMRALYVQCRPIPWNHVYCIGLLLLLVFRTEEPFPTVFFSRKNSQCFCKLMLHIFHRKKRLLYKSHSHDTYLFSVFRSSGVRFPARPANKNCNIYLCNRRRRWLKFFKIFHDRSAMTWRFQRSHHDTLLDLGEPEWVLSWQHIIVFTSSLYFTLLCFRRNLTMLLCGVEIM